MEEIKKEDSGGSENIRNKRRKKIALVILVSLILIGAVSIFFYLRYKATHISTDDAYVEGRIHTIASKVPGTVKSISVRDNQFVKIGDLLLEIDPVDYDVKVKKASSKLRAEKSKLNEIEAKIETSKKQLSEFQRNIEIRAPSDGYVTKKSVETGNQIQVGQPLMAIVPLDDIWIIANYKETQIEKVRPGQKVKIRVDTYPGKEFKGKVDSIMAGTGAVFSLFPPENATGSYVKVVQRIPVKILLDEDTDPEHILRIGMSIVPTIIIE